MEDTKDAKDELTTSSKNGLDPLHQQRTCTRPPKLHQKTRVSHSVNSSEHGVLTWLDVTDLACIEHLANTIWSVNHSIYHVNERIRTTPKKDSAWGISSGLKVVQIYWPVFESSSIIATRKDVSVLIKVSVKISSYQQHLYVDRRPSWHQFRRIDRKEQGRTFEWQRLELLRRVRGLPTRDE